jgi:PHD/YefM family antitoxin component YafN of YafNO toxin-antitoxin module
MKEILLSDPELKLSLSEAALLATDEPVRVVLPSGRWLVLTDWEDYEFAQEIRATSQNQAFMKLLEARSQETERISFEDLKAEFGLDSAQP